MAVDEFDRVDIVSVDASDNVVLTISDHLDWFESERHQLILQEKFNRYLAFVESGEILDRYPDAKGRPVILRVVTQHDPDVSGTEFLARAQKAIETAGFGFQHIRFRRPEPR